MDTYVVLLRGIMPTNPSMRGEKLKGAFESLGLENVTIVIASGNVIFYTSIKDTAILETRMAVSFTKELGFSSTTIIRSKEELEKLVRKNPSKVTKDGKPNYLMVIFFKDRKKEVCTVLGLNVIGGPEFMRSIEKKHGKEITTRTWKTIGRILAKMQ